MPANQSMTWFYMIPSATGALSATATSTNFGSDTLNYNSISSGGGTPPTQVAFFNPPDDVIVNECSTAFYVQAQDALNNAADVTSNTTISLSGTSAQFYTTSDCSGGPVNEITLSSGSNLSWFFLRPSVAGALGVNLSTASLGSANHSYTAVNSGGSNSPVKISFFNAPSHFIVDDCSPAVYLQTQDAGNTAAPVVSSEAVTLSGANVQFYSTNDCSGGPISQISVAGGNHTAWVYAKPSAAGSLSMTANSVNYGSATHNYTATYTGGSAVASQVAFFNPPEVSWWISARVPFI